MKHTPNKPTPEQLDRLVEIVRDNRPTYLLLDEIEPKPGNLAEILDKRDEYLRERVGEALWEMLETHCKHGLEARMCPLCPNWKSPVELLVDKWAKDADEALWREGER